MVLLGNIVCNLDVCFRTSRFTFQNWIMVVVGWSVVFYNLWNYLEEIQAMKILIIEIPEGSGLPTTSEICEVILNVFDEHGNSQIPGSKQRRQIEFTRDHGMSITKVDTFPVRRNK